MALNGGTLQRLVGRVVLPSQLRCLSAAAAGPATATQQAAASQQPAASPPPPPPPNPDTVEVFVDGQPITVPKSFTVIQACDAAGVDIPR